MDRCLSRYSSYTRSIESIAALPLPPRPSPSWGWPGRRSPAEKQSLAEAVLFTETAHCKSKSKTWRNTTRAL